MRITGRLALAVLTLGCASATATTEVDLASIEDQELRIELDKSGGIAGVSYAIVIENDGTVRGARCERHCDWSVGDVLTRIGRATLEDLVRDFADAGLFQLDDHDFGDACCDFFSYQLSVRAGDHDAAIEGAEANIPQDILAVIHEVERLIDA